MSGIELVKEFTRALDNNDFKKAGGYLAPDCVYHYGDNKIVGRESILQSYEDNFKKGAEKLDEIQFFSEVKEAKDAGKFTIHYLDRIRKGAQWHNHRCEQDAVVKESMIVELTHRDLPGEIESLKKFKDMIGWN